MHIFSNLFIGDYMKKLLKTLLNIFFTAIILTAIIFGVSLLIGFRPYIVLSGSMEPSIQTGSLVFVDTKSDFEEVAIGDVIAYKAGTDTLVTHRVIGRESGLLETKGDNNEISDGFTTSKENFVGMTMLNVPKAGYFFAWIQTKRGIILSVTAVTALLILDIALSEDKKKEE